MLHVIYWRPVAIALFPVLPPQPLYLKMKAAERTGIKARRPSLFSNCEIKVLQLIAIVHCYKWGC